MAAADSRARVRNTAIGGLLTALALLFILLSSLTPTGDLALMTLASLCVAIAVLETGTRGALIVYASAAIISSYWPGIAFSYMFVTFFGLFPLIKAFSEKKWQRPYAVIFKIAVSALLISFTSLVFLLPAIQSIVRTYGTIVLPLVFLGALILVLIYDYALSLLIILYQRRRPSHR